MALNQYTLPYLLQESLNNYKDNIALKKVDSNSFSYTEFDHYRKRISFWLASQGIMKTEKVAILSENSPYWVFAFWGIACLGAVDVPILPEFAIREINIILEHSDSKILFISARLYKKHKELLEFKGKIVIPYSSTYKIRIK